MVSIDKNSQIPFYMQITKQVRDMIITGVLPSGYKLPPERKLADMLGVNRTTVLNAYRELKADALVDSRVGYGTVVLPVRNEKPQPKQEYVAPAPWKQFLSQSALRTREPLLRDLLEMAGREDVISFAAGIAALEMDPVKIFKELQDELVEKHSRKILQHTPTEGCYPLREEIGKIVECRGAPVTAEEVLVLSGSQQGIELTAKVFLDTGDVVVVEEPSFFSALQIFQVAGAKILGVPTDENGMKVDILEQLLTRYKPKLIYTMPTFQNPSGAVMSIERRLKLLELAYKYQVPVLEDDPYFELRYEGRMIPPLKALDKHGYVMYLSTFSKILFPGLRIGWMAAPKQVIRQYTLAKQMADLHANSISQWLIESFLRKGLLQEHLNKIRKEYVSRRDVMIETLEKYKDRGIRWSVPEGGFYLWCSLPEGIDQARLLQMAAKQKVAFVPGGAFYMEGEGRNFIRLSFTFPDHEQIREGIKRLMESLDKLADEAIVPRTASAAEVKPII